MEAQTVAAESKPQRMSWDEYFCQMAKVAATRSTCPRLSVGAVLVRDRMILATGYNGSVRSAPHCIDSGCVLVDGHCLAAVHAEANAILQAAKNGVNTAFSTMYITVNPCLSCFKIMYQAGVKRIVYANTIPEHLYKSVDYGVFNINNNCMPEMKCMDADNTPDSNY
jgi:dCMP deaminase